MILNAFKVGLFTGLVLCSQLALAEGAPQYDTDCVQKALLDSATTLEEIRKQCVLKEAKNIEISAFEKRLQQERLNRNNQFSIQSYLPNYVLFGSYNFSGTNQKPFKEVYEGEEFFDPVEVKFQISLKVPISENFLGWGDHWFVGYTNRSFWQAYNHTISAPFRETNHAPEAWISFDNDWRLLGWQNRLVDLGVVHQSNGQTGALSRSWNRAYLRFIFEQENSAFGFMPWIRLPETDPTDDNPDILKYMGYGEFYYLTKYDEQNFRVIVRNNFDANDNKGSFELSYTYPIHRNLNGYVQWFYGYGESLIDYNYKNNTLSLGVQLGNLF
ncbi:phospholipase A [Thiosulfativibrio zosterae]|uniref:Phospholipase A1 n=1 Tax=Thiosulfativibrio zosterae TaxID=2675053 RepID=A0A6F8PP71_9GAMM|nr:phospholipase A [Thiosulfativibrio zosterae]BBP43790.1 hypothetical protein THMIRHAT_15360 [Thiosulfativibrio zosterae]